MPNPVPRHPKAKHIALRTIGAGANAVGTILNIVPSTPAKRTRVAIVHDGHVLLVKNLTNFRNWTLPGGGYHKNESAAHCAARELREELGIRLSAKQLGQPQECHERQRGTLYRYDTFIAQLDNDPALKLSWELSHAKWFPLHQLPSNTSAYIPKLLKGVSS